jgi:hypothetical protein
MIKIDLQKALEIHKTQIRKKRDELFPSLDIQFMRALEQSNSELATSIGIQKQSLRDATNIETGSIVTLSDLKSIWDTELLGETPYK